MMTIEIGKIKGPLFGQSELCEPILRALPDWFGIEEATRQYVVDMAILPPSFWGEANPCLQLIKKL